MKGYTDDLAARIEVFPNIYIFLLTSGHNLVLLEFIISNFYWIFQTHESTILGLK